MYSKTSINGDMLKTATAPKKEQEPRRATRFNLKKQKKELLL